MRISPIHVKQLSVKSAMTGAGAFKKSDCCKPRRLQGNDDGDIFVSLAKASLCDVKIENELKSMGLIG